MCVHVCAVCEGRVAIVGGCDNLVGGCKGIAVRVRCVSMWARSECVCVCVNACVYVILVGVTYDGRVDWHRCVCCCYGHVRMCVC